MNALSTNLLNNLPKASLTAALSSAGLSWQSPCSDIELSLKRYFQITYRGMASVVASDLASRFTVRWWERASSFRS